MEMNTTPARRDRSVLIKMEAAINAHDIDTFVTCFANDFVSEQPVHPERDFTGVEQLGDDGPTGGFFEKDGEMPW